MEVLHVNVFLHCRYKPSSTWFQHHWTQTLRLHQTMAKSYSCNGLSNQKRTMSPVCAHVKHLSKITVRSKGDRKPKGDLLWSSIYQWQAYITTRVVNLTSYHYVTVGSPASSGALSLSQCLKTRLAMLNENPPDRLACRLKARPVPFHSSILRSHIWRQQLFMVPRDVLWQGTRERAAKWIQGWAKRSFQRRFY